MTKTHAVESEGTILYDGACGFCSRWVGFWAPTLKTPRISSRGAARIVGSQTTRSRSRTVAGRHPPAYAGRQAGLRRKCVSACRATHLVDDALLGNIQSAGTESSTSPWISLVRAQPPLCFRRVQVGIAAIVLSSLPLTASFLYTLGLPQA